MIKNWLNRPFPFIESLRDTVLISLTAGSIVTIFLIIFQPFSIDTIHASIYLYLSGFGLITTVVIALSFILLPYILPIFINHDHWTIGKNILLVFFVLIVISSCNFIYGQFIVSSVYSDPLVESERTGLLSWIFMTFTVGIFPVFFIIYFAERQLLKRNQRIASEINEGMHKPSDSRSELSITLELSKSNSLEIKISQLVCVRVEGGNYATVYWQDDLDTHKELLRITLLDFLEKVGSTDSIVRCHKSHVVNLDKVGNVRGNARSLVLELEGVDFEIPVSRSFPRRRLTKTA
ncbi:MAG: hypothetical protein DRI71_06445 [Bacteroidetes bacterium]|nr:MAG: hypothetical protein DRI71_06445 [Bacteroidota bacterium]